MAVKRFSTSTIAQGLQKSSKISDQNAAAFSMQYLVIAGGGGGGLYQGGGGGAQRDPHRCAAALGW